MGSEKKSRELELKLVGTAHDMPAFKRVVTAVTQELLKMEWPLQMIGIAFKKATPPWHNFLR